MTGEEPIHDDALRDELARRARAMNVRIALLTAAGTAGALLLP